MAFYFFRNGCHTEQAHQYGGCCQCNNHPKLENHMFKFRQLTAGVAVSLGLAGAAQPLMAQSVIDFLKDNKTEKKQEGDTLDMLERQLSGSFKGLVTQGSGDTRTFTTPKLEYRLQSDSDSVSWTVDFGTIKRGDVTLVRMYFNCQTLPENVDVMRLKQMLSWSGGHASSTAYFKTLPVGKKSQLYIVADYHLDATKNIDWNKELGKMFVMADDTLYLWSGDLTKPISQKETKNDTPKEKINIAGLWDGKVFINDDEVGQYSIQFMNGVIVASRTRNGDAGMSMLTGTYTLDGNKLTIQYKDVEKPEIYEVNLKGKSLTLTSKKGSDTLSVKMSKG